MGESSVLCCCQQWSSKNLKDLLLFFKIKALSQVQGRKDWKGTSDTCSLKPYTIHLKVALTLTVASIISAHRSSHSSNLEYVLSVLPGEKGWGVAWGLFSVFLLHPQLPPVPAPQGISLQTPAPCLSSRLLLPIIWCWATGKWGWFLILPVQYQC